MSIKDQRTIKKKSTKSAAFPGLLMQALMDYKWFEVRKDLNKEHHSFLSKSKEFKNDVKSFRKEFNVPKLDPYDDYKLMYVGPMEIEDSKWLRTHDRNFIDNWEKGLTELMNKYQLPTSFHDWVDWSILYGKPKYYPHYNIEGLMEVMQNPYKTNKTGLTTNEKGLLLELLGMDIKKSMGQKKKALKLIKPHIVNTINQNKNQRRRSRTLNTSLKTLNLGTKETYFDYSLNKDVSHKTTSADLATSIFNDDLGEKASLVRKQKERLLRRHLQTSKKT